MRNHDFSIVIGEQDRVMLHKLMMITKCKNEGGVISYIITHTMPYLKLKHCRMLIENKKYNKVGWTKKLHINIRENEYNFIKQVHRDLDTYSMAGIIRLMMHLVFLFYYFYGAGCFGMLCKFMKEIINILNDKKIWTNNNCQFPELSSYIVNYNWKNEIIRIQFE